MAGESIIQLNSGSGPKAHTYQRTIGANNVEDGIALLGEPYLPSYLMGASNIATTNAASHLMQIMAGSSFNVRIKRITVTQAAAPAAVTFIQLIAIRLTSAGTGGTAVTAAKFDNGDAAAGATGMTLPTVLGTLGTNYWIETLQLGTAAIPTMRNRFEWIQMPNSKPFIIPAGTANGLAIRNTTGLATSTVDISVEFTESSFL